MSRTAPRSESSSAPSASEADVADLRRDGYVILPEVVPSATVEAVRRELSPYLQGRLMGRNEIEGLKSERVYALLAKSPTMADLIEQVEQGYDHDQNPLTYTLPHLKMNIDMGAFHRNRAINRDSSFSVIG